MNDERNVMTPDLIRALGDRGTSVSWVLSILQQRVAGKNAPKTQAYLILAAQAVKEELEQS